VKSSVITSDREIENPGHVVNKQYGGMLRIADIDEIRALLFTK